MFEWDPHKNRLASTFFDPNFTGAYLVICATLLFKYLHKKRRLALLSLLILILGIFLTFSRSSWAMFAFVILVYGLFRYRWLLLASLLLGFSAYFFVPRVQTRLSGATDPADSAHFRIISWNNTWTIAKDNLLTGVGFNAFRYSQRDYGFLDVDNFNKHSGAGSDSSLLFVLVTTGVFGLVVFLCGFTEIFKTSGDNRLLLLAVVGGLFLHSLFVNSLFFPQIMFLWLILLTESNYSFHK
jgi:O-antigen ligase